MRCCIEYRCKSSGSPGQIQFYARKSFICFCKFICTYTNTFLFDKDLSIVLFLIFLLQRQLLCAFFSVNTYIQSDIPVLAFTKLDILQNIQGITRIIKIQTYLLSDMFCVVEVKA